MENFSNGIVPGVQEKAVSEDYNDGTYFEGHGFEGRSKCEYGIWRATIGDIEGLGETRPAAIARAMRLALAQRAKESHEKAVEKAVLLGFVIQSVSGAFLMSGTSFSTADWNGDIQTAKIYARKYNADKTASKLGPEFKVVELFTDNGRRILGEGGIR